MSLVATWQYSLYCLKWLWLFRLKRVCNVAYSDQAWYLYFLFCSLIFLFADYIDIIVTIPIIYIQFVVSFNFNICAV